MYVKQLAFKGGLPMSIKSFLFRRGCLKSDRARDAGLTTPPDIERFDDISYGRDPKYQVLDLYRPRKFEGVLPVIVSVHGGGWVYGSKEIYQYYCMNLAQRGFAVVNFSYRLAPKHKLPAPLEDTSLVFNWMLNNAVKYRLDPDAVFAVGDSAGAHLLSTYACIAYNPDYAKEFPFRVPHGLRIKGMALNCGIYSFDADGVRELYGDFMKEKGTPQERAFYSPINHIPSKYPACYVMTSNEDFLRLQAPLMVKTLEDKGIPCRFKEYGDENTKLYHVFHCNIKSEEARVANDDECAFFKGLMK